MFPKDRSSSSASDGFVGGAVNFMPKQQHGVHRPGNFASLLSYGKAHVYCLLMWRITPFHDVNMAVDPYHSFLLINMADPLLFSDNIPIFLSHILIYYTTRKSDQSTR
jgi:hypothetical protein